MSWNENVPYISQRKEEHEISSVFLASLGVYRPCNANHCCIVFNGTRLRIRNESKRASNIPSPPPPIEHRETDIHPSENRLKAWMTVARCVAVARFAPWLIVNVYTGRQWLAKRETPAWNAPNPCKISLGEHALATFSNDSSFVRLFGVCSLIVLSKLYRAREFNIE